MSIAGDAGAERCPGCGAPPEDDAGEAAAAARCAYCGTVLRRPRPVPAARPRAATSPGRRALIVYAGIVAAVMIVAALINLRAGRQRLPAQALRALPSLTRLGAPPAAGNGVGELLATVPGPDGTTDVVAALDRDGHAVGLFDGRSHALRWRAGSFARSPRRESAATDATRAFVVDESRVTALSLKDGAELWQASLLTELGAGCAGCLRAVRDRVVALQKDGTLQAFDAATGQVAWTVKLERQPRRLFAVGDELIVEHVIIGRNARGDIDLVDPRDGSTIRTMSPSCLNSAFHQPERPNDGTPLLFDDAGKTLYTIFGFFSHCAQAWDLGTGQRRWTTHLPKWKPNGTVVLGRRALMFENEEDGITALDTATGKARVLLTDKEYATKPLYARDDEVVIKAAPHWDSGRVALWGLDAVTGTKRWQFPLSAQHLSLDTFLDTWSWRRTPAGLVVLQQLPDDQVSIDVVNPLTGVSAGRRVFSGRGYQRSTLRDDLAWVAVLGGVDAIKLPEGVVAYHLQ